MRAASTYRGARRNAARENDMIYPAAGYPRQWGTFGQWRRHAASKANEIAKLPARRKTCAEANKTLALAMARHPVTWTVRDTVRALREFWLTQKPSRVRSRILRELRV